MSNKFWIGLAAIGGAAWWLLRSKPAGADGTVHPVENGTTLSGQGTSAYGQFPGLTQAGAAGAGNTAGGSDPSGSLDNSRVFDPYAQSQADPLLSGIDMATGLPYPDRSASLDDNPWQTSADGSTIYSVSKG